MRIAVPVGFTALVLLAAPASADRCPKDRLDALPARISDGGTTVAYRMDPVEITVGKPFSIEIVACVDGEKRTAPARIRVDAGMPMHGHGMNYKPGEKKLGPGHSAFDGMLFHMRGEWQLIFDIFAGGERRRLTRKVTVGG